MPWKEPGEKPREPRGRDPRGHEPWGSRRGNSGGPDIEAWLRRGRRRLGPFGHGPLGVLALLVLLVVLWFAISGWTVVGNHQVGILLRFGRLEAVLQPGLHFHAPMPIDRVEVVDLGRTRTVSDNVRLLTQDGQLAMVDYYVQYKVDDARKFLFASRDAQDAVRNAATVAVRAVVGSSTLAELMDRSDGKLGQAIRAKLDDAVARAAVGVSVSAVGIQNVGVPSQARKAFEGITKAREGAKSAVATAHADVDRGKVEAHAKAASLKTAAAQYRSDTVAQAHADVARFGEVLAQYHSAPQVTRHHLWLQAMHEVLTRNRVVVNTGSGNVIVQFPPASPSGAGTTGVDGAAVPAGASSAPPASGSSTAPVTSGPAVHGAAA